MELRYYEEPPFRGGAPSIFLAGPSPRSAAVPSWRPDALRLLGSLGFGGVVLLPEHRDKGGGDYYADYVEWEYIGLSHATVIAFWVPRRLADLPGLTTNVEFGLWLGRSPERVVYGRPDDADRIRYLDWLYGKLAGRPPLRSLAAVMTTAVERARKE